MIHANKKCILAQSGGAEYSGSLSVFMPPPFSMGGGGGGGGGAYSITAVSTYVHPVRPVPYVTLLVSMQYLLKGLVYWIEILHTGI